MSAYDSQAIKDAARDPAQLAQANINPVTGLATDYLNHFNEAIMLLEMLSISPECLEDFLAWKPATYCEHFEASRSKDRYLAIAAYRSADPAARDCLKALANAMTSVLIDTRTAMSIDITTASFAALASKAAVSLRPLIARAGAVINGETEAAALGAPQAAVDRLMNRQVA